MHFAWDCLASIDVTIMKTKIISFFTAFGLLFSQGAYCEDEYFDDEEDDEFFNRGSIVGEESDEYAKARRRQRFKNWGLALSTTAAGITTFILVKKNK